MFLPGLPTRLNVRSHGSPSTGPGPGDAEILLFFPSLSSTGYSLEAYANSRPRQEIKCVSLTSAAAYFLVSSRCNISLALPDGERAGRLKIQIVPRSLLPWFQGWLVLQRYLVFPLPKGLLGSSCVLINGCLSNFPRRNCFMDVAAPGSSGCS